MTISTKDHCPLVYILTPSYNCGQYIYRLLNSVLTQTYPNIEMTVIDDGSTDNTKDIIISYQFKFAARGYKLNYVYQNNQGLSSTINNGLKLVHGDFLIWPDADDWYCRDDAIEKMVVTFENNINLGIVRIGKQYVDEHTFCSIGTVVFMKRNNIFHDCLLSKNGYFFAAGGDMLRVSLLDEFIPKREIYYEKTAGQNLQLTLPYFYNTEFAMIEEVMQSVLVRSVSMSREKKKLLEVWKVEKGYYNTRINTLKRIPQISTFKRFAYEMLEHWKFFKLSMWLLLVKLLYPVYKVVFKK